MVAGDQRGDKEAAGAHQRGEGRGGTIVAPRLEGLHVLQMQKDGVLANQSAAPLSELRPCGMRQLQQQEAHGPARRRQATSTGVRWML